MIKIHFLGTCSGTEPFEEMHHCSLIVEAGGVNYWFDAGECCAHTAHTSGIDIMKTRALFISHPHIDHIGGMPHLFFCFDKLIASEKKQLINDNLLELFLPDLRILDAANMMRFRSPKNNNYRFKINAKELECGIVFEDEYIRVSAVRNSHIKNADGSIDPHSFSFLVESEGKKIVYSGDVRVPCELDSLIGDGVDYLIMETGHHKVADVCEYAICHNVKRLRFNHHGREILNDRASAQKLVDKYAENSGVSIIICHDGMSEEI